MLDTIKLALKIANTCTVNGFIYWLKRIPVIKKVIPDNLYIKTDIKEAIEIVTTLTKFIWGFFTKALYIFLFFSILEVKGNQTLNFITLFFFLTVIGSIFNSSILQPTKEKFYVVIQMKMDAKKYALSNFILYLIQTIIWFIPALIIICFIQKLNLMIIPISLLFLITLKSIGDAISLKIFEKKEIVIKNKLWCMLILILFGLTLGYGLPILSLSFPIWLIIILSIILIIASIFAFRYILNTNIYRSLYKKTVTMKAIIFDVDEARTKSEQAQIGNLSMSLSKKVQNKKGYDYFNAIFFERHKKILMNSAKKFALVYFFITICAVVLVIVNKEAASNLNNVILTFLPYFLFIMYFTNRGTIITQAMFFNCDHSMLTYRFYRNPKVILKLFESRLRTLIKINTLPAIIIAVALPLLLFLTGGTNNPFNYLLLFISIMAMNVFFSVHYLVLYYLLQPYTIDLKQKSATYSFAISLTYLVCYWGLNYKAPLLIFSLAVIIFSVIYALVALYLVYKKAPDTFKLKN